MTDKKLLSSIGAYYPCVQNLTIITAAKTNCKSAAAGNERGIFVSNKKEKSHRNEGNTIFLSTNIIILSQ